MMGRSGSSLTAGLFNLHGVWCGPYKKSKVANPKGFFENREIKDAQRKWTGGKHFLDVPEGQPGWKQKVERIITEQGYRQGPWLFKTGATFWKVWYEFDPTWILVWRDKESIFNSVRRAGFMNLTDKQLRKSIDLHHEEMDKIKKTRKAFDVYPNDLINGDYSSIKTAIEGCGLEYDELTVRNFIEPKYWH